MGKFAKPMPLSQTHLARKLRLLLTLSRTRLGYYKVVKTTSTDTMTGSSMKQSHPSLDEAASFLGRLQT